MRYTDYYAILGLEKNAEAKDIRQAYWRLAKAYHPDIHPGDPEAEQKFKEINEAYEVLSDPQKRARYDQLGAHWQDFSDFVESFNAQQRQRHQVEFDSELFDLSFSDFFATFFGEQAEKFWDKYTSVLKQEPLSVIQKGTKGEDPKETRHSVQVSLEEVLHGTRRQIQIHENRQLKTIDVKIPPGIKAGSTIQIRHHHFLEIHYASHPRFVVEGPHLHGQVSIMDYEAMLGTRKVIDTLTGQMQLKIPAGSQAGQVFRLRGEGLPLFTQAKKRGDLLLTLQIETSRNLSATEQELIQRFRQLREKRQQ